MHVQFEFTQDDFVDAAKRFFMRSKNWRSSQRNGLIFTVCMTWLLIFWFSSRTLVQAGIITLICVGVAAPSYVIMQKRSVTKRLRRVFHEMFQNAKAVLCEVELRPDGVWVRQMSRQIVYEWPSVAEIKETSDSVDIFTRDAAGVVVRNSAFASPEERSRFIELARARLSATHHAGTVAAPTST